MDLNSFFDNKDIRLFIRWLKNQGVYSYYAREVIKYCNRYHQGKNIYQVIESASRSISSVIDYTLVWAETPQGHNFWSHMDTLWRKYCGQSFYSDMKHLKEK